MPFLPKDNEDVVIFNLNNEFEFNYCDNDLSNKSDKMLWTRLERRLARLLWTVIGQMLHTT